VSSFTVLLKLPHDSRQLAVPCEGGLRCDNTVNHVNIRRTRCTKLICWLEISEEGSSECYEDHIAMEPSEMILRLANERTCGKDLREGPAGIKHAPRLKGEDTYLLCSSMTSRALTSA
jgi:hypothetical protein